MQLLRLLGVALAGLVVATGYLQEKRRLETIRQLPGPQARDYYEAVRTRGERMMWIVTAALMAGAVVSLVRLLLVRGGGPLGT